MEWLKKHEALYRALRTFFQASVGVLAAKLLESGGVVEKGSWEALIVLAVATGLAAVMNLSAPAK